MDDFQCSTNYPGYLVLLHGSIVFEPSISELKKKDTCQCTPSSFPSPCLDEIDKDGRVWPKSHFPLHAFMLFSALLMDVAGGQQM